MSNTRHIIRVMFCLIRMNISGMSDDVGMASRASDVTLVEGSSSVATASSIITMLNRIATRARPLSEWRFDMHIAMAHSTIAAVTTNIPSEARLRSVHASNPLCVSMAAYP